MLRLVFSIFLVLHGITHAFVFTGDSRLAFGLLGLTMTSYAVVGGAVLLKRPWWRAGVYVATALSALLLTSFWNEASLWGLPVDTGLILGVVAAGRIHRAPVEA